LARLTNEWRSPRECLVWERGRKSLVISSVRQNFLRGDELGYLWFYKKDLSKHYRKKKKVKDLSKVLSI
jgi:hypothetical protein